MNHNTINTTKRIITITTKTPINKQRYKMQNTIYNNDNCNANGSNDYNNLCSAKAQFKFTRFKLLIMATMEILQLQQTIMNKQKQLRMVVERLVEYPRSY